MTPAEKRRDYFRKYNKANREKKRAAWRKWRASHPEAAKAHSDAWTARRRELRADSVAAREILRRIGK